MVRIQDVTLYNLTPPGSGAAEAISGDRKTPRIVRDNLDLTIFWQLTGPTKAITSSPYDQDLARGCSDQFQRI